MNDQLKKLVPVGLGLLALLFGLEAVKFWQKGPVDKKSMESRKKIVDTKKETAQNQPISEVFGEPSEPEGGEVDEHGDSGGSPGVGAS